MLLKYNQLLEALLEGIIGSLKNERSKTSWDVFISFQHSET